MYAEVIDTYRQYSTEKKMLTIKLIITELECSSGCMPEVCRALGLRTAHFILFASSFHMQQRR